MPAAASPLVNVPVLVTRPATQADGLCEMIEAAGGRAVLLPLIRVEARPLGETTLAAFACIGADDVVIFVSTNAVCFGAPLLRQPLGANAHCTVMGVGEATIDALRAAGWNPRPLPPTTEASSEGLLQLERLGASRIAGRQVLIVRGEGGRELLADTLRERGAEVHYAEVYRRVPNDIDLAATFASAERPQLSSLTSVEGAEHFAGLIRAQRADWLLALPQAVLSRRIGSRAAELGFCGAIEVAERASDAALLGALTTLAARLPDEVAERER